MWSSVQKMLKTPANDAHPPQGDASVALGKGPLSLEAIKWGHEILFSPHCPLPELAGQTLRVSAVRVYRFGEERLPSYQVQRTNGQSILLAVAKDAQGDYLALSRPLNAAEQDRFFGRDALSFFTEPSTAKTIRCKADLSIEGAWAGGRYTKTVDWIEGVLEEPDGTPSLFRYNLLLTEDGARALEIEHDEQTSQNRVYLTVYRPMGDIARWGESVAENPMMPQPLPESVKPVVTSPMPPPSPSWQLLHDRPSPEAPRQELPVSVPLSHSFVAQESYAQPRFVPLFPAPVPEVAQSLPEVPPPPPRPDFRRTTESDAIHVARVLLPDLPDPSSPPLPAFLIEKNPDYLSLDEVIPPESERVRCSVYAAKKLIDEALARKVRVRDVLREMVGLQAMVQDEVIFELPLTDADYRHLAQRYRVRGDDREAIREALEREFQEYLPE